VLRRAFPAAALAAVPVVASWLVSIVGGAPLHVVRRYVENHKQAA
jgi:hypothetical protein